MGEKTTVGAGVESETLVIAAVGTPGATAIGSSTSAGATILKVADAISFTNGQLITIGAGANSEQGKRRHGVHGVTVVKAVAILQSPLPTQFDSQPKLTPFVIAS